LAKKILYLFKNLDKNNPGSGINTGQKLGKIAVEKS
jgi:hypothetical protein